MNKVYLLDTNIVSEFTKDNPNQKVLALYTARKNNPFFLFACRKICF